ncbi:MBL fold metallo-hydrolase [Oscillatoria salina]|uniref:MBL fold metallo-hydrolase n=1 Tax=Oscillatoria salina TaxID=331517 RepID=UPI0013B9402C|nr:MBL fold metallo-hydrolase [Oscillatoria salina]MBZ8181806.1 MBL fold metallo-hydrolase [Oscillatoria salina IIICB1]NET87026.1 MBL fold metallo-hydrolase [Kamptonema sp. SIO1D9]
MKRRQLMRYAGASLLTATATAFNPFKIVQAQTDNALTVEWLGHTCFLFTGSDLRILVNPFRTLGCTAGYRLPRPEVDLVLISSQMLDEGAAENLPGNPKILFEPGVYRLKDVQFQGIGIAHDRQQGLRFGTNVAWRWKQGGVDILHMGGAAAPIEIEQKILMGTPDLALIPVGGGPKAYDAREAKQAMQVLSPKIVVPTHYRTAAADETACNIAPVDEFLQLTEGMPVKRLEKDKITITSQDLPNSGTEIRVFSYNF